MFSQNKEEIVILTHFRSFVGTFLDIGAYDGVRLSNTRALALRGWNGVMVEPSQSVFKQLQANYAELPNIELHNVAIGQTGEVDFYDNDNAVGTIYKSESERWKDETFTVIKAKSMTVKELIAVSRYKHFDFISIDAEGCDLEILRQINLFGVKLLCVEYNGKNISEFSSIMKAFRLIHRNAENLIYKYPR